MTTPTGEPRPCDHHAPFMAMILMDGDLGVECGECREAFRIEPAYREATAATEPLPDPARDEDAVTLLALSQHLDHHTPVAAIRRFPSLPDHPLPAIDCRCGWKGLDWPVHFYGTIRARLAGTASTPETEGSEAP